MNMLTKDQLLEPLSRNRKDDVVVTCMGVTRPWARYSTSEMDFASADSAMGHTADLALGIALAQPTRKVICLNGDGSMLMTLGTLATIVEADARNLVLFVIENESYEITGNQPIPAAGRIEFASMARSMGFVRVYSFEDAPSYEQQLPSVLSGDGPVFVSVRVQQGSEGPISRGPKEQAHYLRDSIAESAHRLREALILSRQKQPSTGGRATL